MKRLTAVITACLLAIGICSCEQEPNNQSSFENETKVTNEQGKEIKSGKTLTLYFCYSDSLDPYKANSSGNQTICPLLFDSLVKLDENLNPKNVIADKIEVDGKTVRITIKNHRFSDGSYITASDILYSIGRCKKAKAGTFVNQLENIKRYTSVGDEIVLTLAHADRNIERILDFPILKKGSADKTNSDGKHIPPIGSGRYIFVDNKGEFSLKGNENYYNGKPENKILLKNIPDDNSLEYLIRSNSINIYFSGFDSVEMPALKSGSKNVTMTNMVYLGINLSTTFLKDGNIRKAISSGLSRNYISEKCYYSLSKPALSLFNDKNSIIKNSDSIFSANEKTSFTKSLVAQSGYKTLSADGYYTNENKQHITVTLLYNKDNSSQSMTASNIIKQMKACGIEVVSDGRDSSSYKNAIDKGDYELYLAEIRLNKSFDYTSLLKTKVKLPKKDKFSSVYEKYLNGETEIDEMLTAFSEEIPFIPLIYRLGTVSYFGNFSEELISSVGDCYYNIEKIKLK